MPRAPYLCVDEEEEVNWLGVPKTTPCPTKTPQGCPLPNHHLLYYLPPYGFPLDIKPGVTLVNHHKTN